jgi:outer membrane receptor protein involved in Fe transport
MKGSEMRVGPRGANLRVFLGLALVVSTAPLFAQDIPEGPVFTEIIPAWATEVAVTLPKVTVPLKACPAGISVVDPNVLETMPRSASADEALALVPGIQADNPLGQLGVRLSVRGQAAWAVPGVAGVQILLDGIPLNDPCGYAPGLFVVDPSAIQRVEVLRGPVSALYGAGGAGGAVHIITREGPSPMPAGRFDFDLGTDRFWKAFAESGGGDRRGFTYRVSASRTFGDGYRDHATFWSSDLYSKFRWNLDAYGSYVSTILSAVDYRGQDAGGLTEEEVRRDRTMASPDSLAYNAYAQARHIVAGTAGKLIYSAQHDMTYSVFGRWGRTEESLPEGVEHDTWKSPGTTVQYNWHRGRLGGFRNHLSMGFDSSWQTTETSSRPNLGGGKEGPVKLTDATFRLRDYGIMASNRMEFGTLWTVTLSLRKDDIRSEVRDHLVAGGKDLSGTSNYHQTTGRIGVTFNPSDLFNLYASWGQGFLPPAARAVFQDARAAGAYRLHPAATSRGAELGVRGAAGQFLYYDAALFLADSRDDIFTQDPALPTTAPGARLLDGSSARRYGIEAYASWFPLQGLILRGAYTYTHATFRTCLLPAAADASAPPVDCSGRWLPDSPEHRGRLDAQYTWKDRWTLGVTVDARSRFYANVTNDAWAGGYTVVNPRLSYAWRTLMRRGEVFFQVRNALDRKYFSWLQPGIGPGAYFPGPEREFFAGIRLAWNRF